MDDPQNIPLVHYSSEPGATSVFDSDDEDFNGLVQRLTQHNGHSIRCDGLMADVIIKRSINYPSNNARKTWLTRL